MSGVGDAPLDVSPQDALRVWVRVAAQSFGGPAGQIAVIHRIVVDEKRWLDEARFLHALSYCMLLPGPEAQQLATYVGWLFGGVRGGLVAGGLFILPGFLSILLLSVLYAGFGDVTLVTGLFLGLKPAVVAVVFEAVLRLRRRALSDRLAVAIAAAAFAGIFVFQIPFPVIIASAAVVGLIGPRPSRGEETAADAAGEDPSIRPSLSSSARTAVVWMAIWFVPPILLAVFLGSGHVFVRESVFFSKTAVVTFGGAYAVLSYVAQQAVEAYHWLQPREMLDGLGLAETTPGPLIQVVQFVGFLGAYRQATPALPPMMAGVIGSTVTTWVTFAPCFLFIFVGAPYVEYLRRHRGLNRALRGITAAVVGVVLNLAVWFALHTLFATVEPVHEGAIRFLVPDLTTVDWAAAAITVGAMVSLFWFKAGMMRTLGGAAVVGILVSLVSGT